MEEIVESAAALALPPVQDGPIGLGEHGILPAPLSGEEQKALDRANTARAVEALYAGARALRDIETNLENAIHDGVAGARATMNFCIARLDYEALELGKNV